MDLNKIDEEFDKKFTNISWTIWEWKNSNTEELVKKVKKWYHSKLTEAFKKGKEYAYEFLKEETVEEWNESLKNCRLQTLEEVEKKIEEEKVIKRMFYWDKNSEGEEVQILFDVIDKDELLQTIKEMKKYD